MLNKTTISHRTLIALLMAPALSLAQVDTSDWACESCPFDQGYRAQVDGGATNVSEDATRFGNYTGYDEKGTYANVDALGRYNGDGYRIDYRIEDLGLDSRFFDVSIGSEGVFEVHIGYRDLPFRRFDTSSTIFTPNSSAVLTLPSGWVAAGTTGTMAQLASSLQTRNVGTDRQILDVGGRWNPLDNVRLFADFRRHTKDGIDITSAGSYTQASFLPRWVDHETDRIDAGLQYATDRLSLTLAWYGSFFTNNNPALTWETPFLALPDAAVLRQAREPDNDYQQVSLSGKYRFDAWDTIATLLVAAGRGEQNATFLPYTINPGLVSSALPASSLDAEVDTANYAFTLISRPLDRLRVKFGYRYDERDNQAPIYDWNRVIVDVIPGGELEQNVPYSYDRAHTTISVEYVLLDDLRLAAGYEHRETNRDFQEVAEQTSELGWGQIRWKPAAWLNLRAKGGASRRSNDRYDETVAATLGQNPLMRKYNLAYRYREFGEVVVSITPIESPLSFGVTALFADDDYKESWIGLNGSEEFRATFDASWAISEDASAYVIYGTDSIDAHQTGAEQFGFWDWSAFHEDTFDHVGLGFAYRPGEGRFRLRFDYNHGAGETKISLDSLSGGLSHLPTLESTLNAIRAEADYDFTERWTGTFSLRYEAFEIRDWALVSQTTLPTILSMGAQPYDYDVYAVGIGFRYRFGTEEISLVD